MTSHLASHITLTKGDFLMWSNYINQLKAEYFDILHTSMEQWRKDLLLTEKHKQIAKVEEENKQLWNNAPIKTKEGVVEYWKSKNNK